MKKRVIIIPATVLAIASPGAVIGLKHLDTSSTAPVIKSSAEDWSKTATITVATAATFGGSDLDHYEYCINNTDNVESCEWKVSTVETIRVRNLGTSYVWLRAISQYGVVSGISDYVLTRVDRNKPDASAENSVTTSSISVTVTATDDSGIKSYEYSIDDSEYVTNDNCYTFTDLASSTTYNIKIRITDLAGNTKILNFTQTTSSPATTRSSRSFSGINLASMPSGGFSGGQMPSGFPSGKGGKPGQRPSNETTEEQPELPENQEQPEEPTEPEQPEQPTEPEQLADPCEKPAKPEKPPRPEGLEEGEEPEEPEEPEQPANPICQEQPEKPEKPEQPEQPENPEQPPVQPQEPENDDSASGEEEPTSNQPENNDPDDAIENSEPTEENNTILGDEEPSENTSAIEK